PRGSHSTKHGKILLVVGIEDQVVVYLLKKSIIGSSTTRVAQDYIRYFPLVFLQYAIKLIQKHDVVDFSIFVLLLKCGKLSGSLHYKINYLTQLVMHRIIHNSERAIQSGYINHYKQCLN